MKLKIRLPLTFCTIEVDDVSEVLWDEADEHSRKDFIKEKIKEHFEEVDLDELADAVISVKKIKQWGQ